MIVHASLGSDTKSLPQTYQAPVAESTGQSFSKVARISTLPTPTVKEDEALIRIVYAGVNFGCATFRARGEYAFQGNVKGTEPFGLGAEGVGIIVAIGWVSQM